MSNEFRCFWLARVCGTVAFQGSAVAIGWNIYAETHSAFALGLVGLVQYVPMVALVLFVGHVADRYERRRTVVVCQTLEALTIATLAGATLSGHASPALLLATAGVLGTARAFETPTAASLMPNLVPPDGIAAATSRWASASQTAAIIGPTLGGMLLSVGSAWPFVVAALGWGAAAGLTLSVRPRPFVTTAAGAPRSQAVLDGIRMIVRDRVLLGIMSLDLFAVLLGGATALLPMFTQRIFGAGPWALGVLRAAPAIGALVTSLLLARRDARTFSGRTLFAAVAAFGAATIVFGLSRSLVFSFLALVAVGAADVVSVVIRLALVQTRTPDALRGRVNAVNWLFIGTSNQLGEFESGATAALIGPVGSVLLGGVGTIVVAFAWWFIFPQLRSSAADTPPVLAEARAEQELTDAV